MRQHVWNDLIDFGTQIHGSIVKVSTLFLDDHQFTKNDFEMVEELADVCLYYAGFGRPAIFMDSQRMGPSCLIMK